MNKKIKIIELLLKIAHGEYPKRFKYNNKIYEYKRTVNGTGYVTENDDWFNSDIFIDDCENLNEEVEILEDNTEEIEELDKQKAKNEIWTYTDANINKSNLYCLSLYPEHHIVPKINELVKAVNKLRKENNNGKRRK